jgi:hypothetical protein
MKLNLKAFACACATLWALCVLLTGLCNLIWPSYGTEFLGMVASIYPGYKAMHPGFLQVIVGTVYALVDGWICGAVLACLYNRCCCAHEAPAAK